MELSAMEGIAERLAAMDGLYFPGGMRRQPSDASERKTALFDLISRDAPIFLERYGGELTANELGAFDVLCSDYEVGWYVDRLRRSLVPTEADSRTNSVTVKNRRRAYMERLIRRGEYFSEDSMREREPYLHHEYLGRFQDHVGRVSSRPGEKWSETLMRLCEEQMLVKKIRDEQQRLGVARKDWIGGGEGEEEEVSESEESEEEGNEMIVVSGSSEAPEDGTMANDQESAEPPKITLSAEEMQDQMEQFAYVMQQKFLAGEDTEHLDYNAIDNDEGLDDHWIKEASHDAEEKYFDED